MNRQNGHFDFSQCRYFRDWDEVGFGPGSGAQGGPIANGHMSD